MSGLTGGVGPARSALWPTIPRHTQRGPWDTGHFFKVHRRSRHRPVAVVEGSLNEHLNKTGVRFWTDSPLDQDGEVARSDQRGPSAPRARCGRGRDGCRWTKPRIRKPAFTSALVRTSGRPRDGARDGHVCSYTQVGGLSCRQFSHPPSAVPAGDQLGGRLSFYSPASFARAQFDGPPSSFSPAAWSAQACQDDRGDEGRLSCAHVPLALEVRPDPFALRESGPRWPRLSRTCTP